MKSLDCDPSGPAHIYGPGRVVAKFISSLCRVGPTVKENGLGPSVIKLIRPQIIYFGLIYILYLIFCNAIYLYQKKSKLSKNIKLMLQFSSIRVSMQTQLLLAPLINTTSDCTIYRESSPPWRRPRNSAAVLRLTLIALYYSYCVFGLCIS